MLHLLFLSVLLRNDIIDIPVIKEETIIIDLNDYITIEKLPEVKKIVEVKKGFLNKIKECYDKAADFVDNTAKNCKRTVKKRIWNDDDSDDFEELKQLLADIEFLVNEACKNDK